MVTVVQIVAVAAVIWGSSCTLCAQSADWKEVLFREPQVRYPLADMTLGGNVGMYRRYAGEGDPDSREAIRLWDLGSRVINTNDFERKWIANTYGKDGKVMRIVLRGTQRTVTGNDVLLSSDLDYNSDRVRVMLLDLSLGREESYYEERHFNAETKEAH